MKDEKGSFVNLDNSTWLVADLSVADIPGAPRRVGLLVAKATYRIEPDGTTVPEEEDPYPIFAGEEETDLGNLPPDILPRADSAFEVIVLGKAYAPHGKPLPALTVALSVGSERRELAVFGDRHWEAGPWDDSGPRMSDPEPFAEMPLTWQRAFGGRKDVLIDVESPVEVVHPFNPAGKGFDPGPQARALGEALGVPDGFPTWDRARPLPNLEDPRSLIGRWDAEPVPLCWAPVPVGSALHVERGMEIPKEPDPEQGPVLTEGFHHRAHPDWVIPLPPPHAPVVAEGLVPEWGLAFRLPALRVIADWVVGPDEGSFDVPPQGMVFLPEERRFYVVYRRLFPIAKPEGEDRAVRIRTVSGWQGGVQEKD